MTAVVASVFAIAGTANAAPFVYAGGLIKMGSTGTQVMNLQSCLADMGVNAADNIDGIFGAKTKAAVMAFQASKAVKVDGIIGPVTGPLYTAACAMDMAEEEADMVDGFDMADGEEASLSNFKMKKGDEDTITEGTEEEIAIIEFDVDDADVMVERLDLTFEFAGDDLETNDTDPWEAFDTITLMADGKEIASEDVTDNDDWQEEDEPFVFRFSGLNYVVKDGKTGKISVVIETASSVDGSDVTGANDWTVYVDTDGLRAIDTAGLNQYEGDSSEDETFSIEEEGAGEDIMIKSASNDPDASTLKVDENDVSEDYLIHVFKLEADGADVDLNTIGFEVEMGTENFEDVVDSLWIEVDGDEYEYDATSSEADTNVDVEFDVDGDTTVDEDDTIEVKVYATFKKQDTNYADGETIQILNPFVDGEATDDVSDSTSTDSELHTLSIAVAVIDVMSITETVEPVVGTTGYINFKFEVDASDADADVVFDVTLLDGTDTGLTFELLGDGGFDAVSLVKLSGDATFAGTEWTVAEGDTAVFALNTTISGTGTSYVELQTVAGITVDELSDAISLL